MKLRTFFLALGLTFGATISTAHEPTVLVDDNFGGGRFDWTRSAYFVFRYKPAILEGELHLCGAYAGVGSGGISNEFHRAAMREARFTVNGDTVLRSLRYFNQVNRRHLGEELVGTEARCRGLGIMTDSLNGMRFDIVFREGRYRI